MHREVMSALKAQHAGLAQMWEQQLAALRLQVDDLSDKFHTVVTYHHVKIDINE